MAIRLASERDDQLAKSLSHPIGECFPQAVKKDARILADALAPIMGPATRRAIVETLANFVQSMNQVLDQSLTPKGISWRIEAWRTGVPFSEIVLKNTLLYRVDQLFVIHRETGLLICNVSHEDIETNDMDAVSAMLTAIQDFVKDSFNSDENSNLDTVDVGDQRIRLFRTSDIVLAGVIRGIISQDLIDRLQSLIEIIQEQYEQQISGFDGDKSVFIGLDDMLLEHLIDRRKSDPEKSDDENNISIKRFLPWIGVGLATFAIWLYFSLQSYFLQQDVDAFVERLKQAPGITVTAINKTSDKYIIRGLRDPLAEQPKAWLAEYPDSASAIDLDLIPFYSLDQSLIALRLKKQLQLVSTVDYQYEKGRLTFTGQASSDWFDWVDRIRPFLIGVEIIDTSGVKLNDDAIQLILLDTLEPPKSVDLAVNSRQLAITGISDFNWYEQLRSDWPRISEQYELNPTVDVSNYTTNSYESAKRLVNALSSESIGFIDDERLTEQGKIDIIRLTEIMSRLIAIDKQTDIGLKLILIGDSDGIGSRDKNIIVRQQRAKTLQSILAAEGIPENYTELEIDPNFDSDKQKNESKRRVKFRVSLKPFTWDEQ